jgi:hypothetical protein
MIVTYVGYINSLIKKNYLIQQFQKKSANLSLEFYCMTSKSALFPECFEIYLITHSFNSQMEFIGLFFFFSLPFWNLLALPTEARIVYLDSLQSI